MAKLINLRKLNDLGIERFSDFLERKREDSSLKTPKEFIESSETSEDLGLNIEVDIEKKFTNRLEFGKYIWSKFREVWTDELKHDSGLWSGLALIYFDQFCPPKKPNRSEHYILTAGKWRGSGHDLHYRHCVLTPITIVKDYAEHAEFFLCGTVDNPYKDMTKMGEGIEQIASKQLIMRNKNILQAVLKLYQDSKTKLVKTGSMGDPVKKKLKDGTWSSRGKGGVRRFTTAELPRLELIYSTPGLEPKKLIALAGDEFSKSKYNDASVSDGSLEDYREKKTTNE